jgi:hypothetical protein
MSADDLVLERVAFFDGQRLTAGDLDAAQRHERDARALHNRGLHDWGVAAGLGVSGGKGDREVRVAAGLALDRLGRELVVTHERACPVPSVAGAPDGGEAPFVLALGAGEEVETERRDGVCAPAGAVRVLESPAVTWRTPDEARADEVVLAHAWVRNCRLTRPPSPEGRRDALVGPRPRIASGDSGPFRTRWDPWPDPADPASAAGVRVEVETASGGFRATPGYQAQLGGDRLVDDGADRFLLDGHAEVLAATAAAFVLRVAMPRDLRAGTLDVNPSRAFGPQLVEHVRHSLGWHVIWLGVEP